jgi:hypothetical protein
MKHRITAHISPYLGGLAPETHDFVAELNKEAARHRLPVRFTATANRILATGDLKRAADSATLSGWTLRRAIGNGYLAHERRTVWLKRAIRRQTDSEIEGENPVLRRGNSQRREKLRKYEKNRDRTIEAAFSDRGNLKNRIKVAAGTLYHLIDAIPQWKRDAEEIYPGDFRKTFISQPLRTNWKADKLEWWRQLGWGIGGRSEPQRFGLKDYSGPARLLFKSGDHQTVYRQKALPNADVLLVEPWRRDDLIVTGRKAVAHLLTTTALPPLTVTEQLLLLRIGRLYKSGCYWSKKNSRSLFDKCAASSFKAASWARHRAQCDPADLIAIAKRELKQTRREGGRVVCLIPGVPWRQIAAKRHASLAATQESDTKKWASYLSEANLSKTLREQRSLNIVTPQAMRQTKVDSECQPFTKNLQTTRPAERPSLPLLAELPKRRRMNLRVT